MKYLFAIIAVMFVVACTSKDTAEKEGPKPAVVDAAIDSTTDSSTEK